MYNKINKLKGEIKMTNNFTQEVKKELLARVAELKDKFMKSEGFSNPFEYDWDEGVSAHFDFLQYGIRNGNASIIAAVCYMKL